MSEEIKRHVDRVMGGPTRDARNAILATVPAHLREKVRAHVVSEFAKRKRGAK